MFKNLMKRLLRWSGGQHAFDPAQLNDPLAMQTEWTPAKRGGSSFRTHKLIEVNFYRMEFRASLGAILFYIIFIIAGLGIIIGFAFTKIASDGFSFDADTILPLAAGLVFAVVGGFLLYFGTAPIVFDKTQGAFWKGRKTPNEYRQNIKHFAGLEKIHALQLISEYVRSSKHSYYSYELNLVLEDSERINVIDHGKLNRIREDAQNLSVFLNKPVWDAIG